MFGNTFSHRVHLRVHGLNGRRHCQSGWRGRGGRRFLGCTRAPRGLSSRPSAGARGAGCFEQQKRDRVRPFPAPALVNSTSLRLKSPTSRPVDRMTCLASCSGMAGKATQSGPRKASPPPPGPQPRLRGRQARRPLSPRARDGSLGTSRPSEPVPALSKATERSLATLATWRGACLSTRSPPASGPPAPPLGIVKCVRAEDADRPETLAPHPLPASKGSGSPAPEADAHWPAGGLGRGRQSSRVATCPALLTSRSSLGAPTTPSTGGDGEARRGEGPRPRPVRVQGVSGPPGPHSSAAPREPFRGPPASMGVGASAELTRAPRVQGGWLAHLARGRRARPARPWMRSHSRLRGPQTGPGGPRAHPRPPLVNGRPAIHHSLTAKCLGPRCPHRSS